MARIFFFLFILMLSQMSFAAGEGQIRFGVQAGNVGFTENIGGNSVGNAVGAGAVFNYGVTEEMMLEITANSSSHTNLKHNDIGAGVNFFFNSYDAAYFYVSVGANFITHDLTAVSKSATAFGLYGGLGIDFDLGKNFSSGLQALYHNSFGSNIDFPPSINVVPSYSTIMLRLLFVIPKS